MRSARSRPSFAFLLPSCASFALRKSSIAEIGFFSRGVLSNAQHQASPNVCHTTAPTFIPHLLYEVRLGALAQRLFVVGVAVLEHVRTLGDRFGNVADLKRVIVFIN